MVPENVPADGVSFAAGKTGHDRVQISGYVYQFACLFNSGAVETVGRAGLADCHDRRIVFIFVGEITDYGSGQGTYSGLYEYMSGTVLRRPPLTAGPLP